MQQRGTGFLPASVALVLSLAAGSCGASYSNNVTGAARSPGGRWKAVSFVRECRPLRSDCPRINYVSVLDPSKGLPDAEGNAISVDNGGRLPADSNGVIELRLEWKGDDLLIVWYPGPARILSQRNPVAGVRIECRPVGFL
jgi:hypothetical protein